MDAEMKQAIVEVAKAVPPVTVAGFTFFGHPLSEWAQLLAIVYTGLMIFFLLRDRMWQSIKDKIKSWFN